MTYLSSTGEGQAATKLLRTGSLVLASLTLTVATAAGCDFGRSSPSPSHGRTPRTVWSKAAPDGGTLRIVESGYTCTSDKYGWYTFAAVVENTSKAYLAIQPSLDLKFFNAEGTTLTRLGGKPVTTGSTMLPPGERKGFGLVDSGTALGLAESPTKVVAEIQDDTVQWVLASMLPKIVVSERRFSRDPAGKTVMSFQVDSGYSSSDKWPDILLLYRDSAGTLIGGEHRGWFRQENLGGSWPHGRSTQSITVEPPQQLQQRGASTEKTEIYVNPSQPVIDEPHETIRSTEIPR